MKRALLIRRGAGETSRLERYEVDPDAGATLLDALETLRTGVAPDLAYRHSCNHGSCGTCSVRVDGRELLACLTPLASLYPAPSGAAPNNAAEYVPTVEPLRAFEPVADLAVDPGRLFRSLPENTTRLRVSETKEHSSLPAGLTRFTRFEDCIECGCCVSVCPVTASTPDDFFMGPAALAALRRETINVPERRDELLERAAEPDGAISCRRHLACSRVCPRAVYPAKHIELLKKEIAARKD